jgi:hypothetical protein
MLKEEMCILGPSKSNAQKELKDITDNESKNRKK